MELVVAIINIQRFQNFERTQMGVSEKIYKPTPHCYYWSPKVNKCDVK